MYSSASSSPSVSRTTVRSGALAIHKWSPRQASPWTVFRPVAKRTRSSASPSRLRSSKIHTESPGVSGFGLRYCGPMPTHSRPCLSKVIAQGLRTSGSRANKATSMSAATSGKSSFAEAGHRKLRIDTIRQQKRMLKEYQVRTLLTTSTASE